MAEVSVGGPCGSVDGAGIIIDETRAMRAFQNNRFSIGAEGLGNSLQCSLDRVRMHKALLGVTELDSVAANPKAPLASTLVSYSFNETTMPFQSAVAPARPTLTSEENLALSNPRFSTDTPSGREGDFSPEFTTPGPRVTVPDPVTAIRHQRRGRGQLDGRVGHSRGQRRKLPVLLPADGPEDLLPLDQALSTAPPRDHNTSKAGRFPAVKGSEWRLDKT